MCVAIECCFFAAYLCCCCCCELVRRQCYALQHTYNMHTTCIQHAYNKAITLTRKCRRKIASLTHRLGWLNQKRELRRGENSPSRSCCLFIFLYIAFVYCYCFLLFIIIISNVTIACCVPCFLDSIKTMT